MWQRVAGMLLAFGVLTNSVVAQSAAKAATSKAAAPAAAEAEPMVDSSFMNMSWPKFEMPKVNWKGPFAKDETKPAEEGEGFLTAPFKKVTSATQSGIAKTRAKWNTTIDKFRIGDGDAATAGSTTPAEEKPSFFAKMFGGGEPEAKEPLTTSEFLAQERPGMDTK